MTDSKRQTVADVTRNRSGWLCGVCVGVALLVSAAPAWAVEITGVSPDRVWNSGAGGDVTLTITGSGFIPTEFPFVILSKEGEPGIQATDVTLVSLGMITADFDLAGAAAGRWDLSVLLPVGEDTLENGVTMLVSPQIKRISTWGGPVQAMEVREEEIDGVPRQIGYVARGSGLVILDVTDPTNMTELSSLDLESGGVFDLAVQGNYAYVCGRDCYLSVVDVSDPASPRLVVSGLKSHLSSTAPATDIAIHGNVAYVNFGWNNISYGGLCTLDISDPEGLDPAAPGLFHGFCSRVYTATVAGDYLYLGVDVLDGNGIPYNELHIFDVSGGRARTEPLGRAPLFLQGYYISGVAVKGDFAYVTAWRAAEETQLTIVNISNPETPFLNGVFTDLFYGNDVVVSGGIAYLADQELGMPPALRTAKGLAIVDVGTDPTSPTLLGSFDTGGAVSRLTLVGTTAYLLDRGEGVVAVDVSNPANPVRLGNWHCPAFIQSIDTEGDRLFFSDWWNGMTALDISDPRTPTLVSAYQTEIPRGDNGGVQVQDGYAYLAAGYNGLEVIDISDPANPERVARYGSSDDPDLVQASEGLAVRDGVLIINTWWAGNYVFDVSNPPNMALGAWFPAGGRMEDWGITDDFLALGVRGGGCGGLIHDVLDPYNPVHLAGGCGDVGVPPSGIGEAHDLFVDGARLYTTRATDSDFWGLYVYDILETPEWHVSLVGYLPINGASGVAARDGIAYVTGSPQAGTPEYPTWGPFSLLIIDTQPPSSTIIASAPALGHKSVHLDGSYVYTGGKDNADAPSGPSMVTWRVGFAGSVESDGDIDLVDFAGFQNCFGNSCVTFDFDEDGDVDHDDYAEFASVMTGEL